MKQRLLILLLLVGLVAVLAALNAASYVQKETVPDSELTPNRSTFNVGATGTQAFFTLLSETGRKSVRWRESPDALLTGGNKPSVFVMIGALRREITEQESTSLLRWVSEGGRLVIIDREPPKDLCTSSANWKITVSNDPALELISVDPSDQKRMTTSTEAARPVQPTIFTAGVNAVQPSRFAGWVSFDRYAGTQVAGTSTQPGGSRTPISRFRAESAEVYAPTFNAPVVHLAGNQKNLLVDVPFGSGSIVFLADPYIVSNGGINIVDNAQLALNVVSTDGTIAFDEYHQGYGTNSNRLFEYFEGTPVIAIFLQCSMLIGLIFLSQSRRFARPLLENEPDRLSKLEYVTAMAELQQRTRAFDLAVENIYTDFRRRISRVLGIDNLTSTRREIAKLIAERASLDPDDVEAVMLKCEEIIHGEPTNKAEVVTLTARLRLLDEKLGINRTPRGKNGR